MSEIALVCTVWGAEFSHFFCEYCLATLLCPTNLPSAAAAYNFTLLLYTSQDDLDRMKAHPNFRKLETFVDVRIVFIESLPPGARTGHWIQWHHAFLSADEFSSVILLIPDCLYANNAIDQIARALETHDVVYYCIPQICREPVLPYLDSMMRRADGEGADAVLDFTPIEIASLFVKYMTPRYAVALDNPEYFVTHPEYILNATPGKLLLHELTCHALAVSRRAKSLSYAYNPTSPTENIHFLELLAVGVEYTLKYFDLYYQWPASRMMLSRLNALASWSYAFAENGVDLYSKTATAISVSGARATALERTDRMSRRARYARMSMQYRAALYAIYNGPAQRCSAKVKQALALAMCLPGFRIALTKMEMPVTVMLPESRDIERIVDHLYDANDRSRLIRFFLMHVLPGTVMLKTGQTFVFERTLGTPPHRPRLRVVERELANSLTDVVNGRIEAPPSYMNEDIVTYAATIRYGAVADFMRLYLA